MPYGEDEFSLDIIDDLPDIFSDLYNLNSNSEHWPSYVTDTSTLDTINSGGTYDDSDFADNRVTWVNCNGNQGLTIAKNTTLTKVAIMTDCAVTFKNGGAMEDSLIFTISTSANSFKSPQGRLCLESGGNSPAAFSERFDLRLIRRRGQVSLVQLVARAFPSRRPCASGFGLRRGAPKAASARLQRRAARSVF